MNFINPSVWRKSWVLSGEEEQNPIVIPYGVLKDFGRQDIIVLDFLYRSYMKKLNGVILNEEEDINPHLQVSSFLGALYDSLKNKFLVLVLCPDDLMVKWHYYMSHCGKFDVKIITPNTVPEEFDQETGIVLLLSFTNIKLAEYLKEYDFFSVVIDSFDEVATKLVIRKLQGNFDIGVTAKNFYEVPNQKLQWTMLNWANPNCVGKLADFYEVDNDNFANFRDNYKEWWFRLTWSFCDTFVKPTLEEKGKLNHVLREWGKTHNLTANLMSQNTKNRNARKRKAKTSFGVKEESFESEDHNQKKQETFENKDNKHNERTKKVYNKNTAKTKKIKKIPYKTAFNKTTTAKSEQKNHISDLSSNSSDSSDTIVYENESYTNLGNDTIEALDEDKPPIGAPLNQGSKEQNKKGLEENIDGRNKSDVSHSDDDNNSVSSGEQLLFSLVRTQDKKSSKNTKPMVEIDHQNESDNFEESDLFLKSVASTNSDFSPLKNRQKAEKFFDKILESDVKPVSNYLTQMEMELTEKEVLDFPSDSDSFLKGIFNKRSKNESSNTSKVKEEEKHSENINVSLPNGHVDVDTLVAEVMAMVGKK